EDGIRGRNVTGVQTCALPIYTRPHARRRDQGDREKEASMSIDVASWISQTESSVGSGVRFFEIGGKERYPLTRLGARQFRKTERSEERRVGKECNRER